jgi:hypothetical protein
MTEDQQRPTEASTKTRRSSAGPNNEQILRQARVSYDEYISALGDAWQASDPEEKVRQAYAEYLATAGAEWTPARTAERNAEAARSYSRALQASLDPEQDGVAAYRKYVIEVTEQQPAEAENRVRTAYHKYLDACGEALAPDELEQRSNAAWTQYIGELKKAWSQVDASAEPATVAALAQSASAAVAALLSVQETVRQRELARQNLASASHA